MGQTRWVTLGKAISFLPLSLFICRMATGFLPQMPLQDRVNQMEWAWSVFVGGAPLGMRGVEGSQGGEEESGAGKVPADIFHPACLSPGGPGGAMLPILSSLPGVLFFRSSPEAVRGRPCFAGSVGPPGGSQGYFVSPLAAGRSLGFPLVWRGIPVLGKQWLRLLPQPIAFCVREGKAPRKSVFPKE